MTQGPHTEEGIGRRYFRLLLTQRTAPVPNPPSTLYNDVTYFSNKRHYSGFGNSARGNSVSIIYNDLAI